MIFTRKFMCGNIQRNARSNNIDGPSRPPQDDQKNINITRKNIMGHISNDVEAIKYLE